MGGANSREARLSMSRDLLRLRKSFVKLFTEMRGFALPAGGEIASSDVCVSDMKESSEKRLEGCGREKVRGGGSSTVGVGGWFATEWPGDTEDVRLLEIGSVLGADNDISLGATLFREEESSSPFRTEAARECAGGVGVEPGIGREGGEVRFKRSSFATWSNGTVGHCGEVLTGDVKAGMSGELLGVNLLELINCCGSAG